MSAAVSQVSAAARGRVAEAMVPVAMAFVGVVRDQDGEGVGNFLRALSGAEREALPVILAAMVPDDKTPQELLAWVTWDENGDPLPRDAEMVLYRPRRRKYERKVPRQLQPCGTWAAAQRHRAHGEDMCEACKAAAREYYRSQNHRKPREGAA